MVFSQNRYFFSLTFFFSPFNSLFLCKNEGTPLQLGNSGSLIVLVIYWCIKNYIRKLWFKATILLCLTFYESEIQKGPHVTLDLSCLWHQMRRSTEAGGLPESGLLIRLASLYWLSALSSLRNLRTSPLECINFLRKWKLGFNTQVLGFHSHKSWSQKLAIL